MADLGSSAAPLSMTGEQDVLEVRTTDPTSPAPDERWIRSDIAPQTDQIATMRCGDGTDIPIFATGTATDTVRECRRVRVGGQTGYMPVAPLSDAEFTARRVQHDGQTMAYHKYVIPPAIPDKGNLQAWYDATQLSLSDQDSVTTWGDESENAHDLTDDGSPPTFIEDGINGNPSVESNQDYLTVEFSTVNQPITVYVMFEAVDNGLDYPLFGNGPSGGLFAGRVEFGDDLYQLSAGSVLTGGSPNESPNILTFRIDGSDSLIRLDGSELASGDAGSNALEGITLFANRDASGDTEAQIGENLWYATAHGSSTMADVESYLSSKWGVSI